MVCFVKLALDITLKVREFAGWHFKPEVKLLENLRNVSGIATLVQKLQSEEVIFSNVIV